MIEWFTIPMQAGSSMNHVMKTSNLFIQECFLNLFHGLPREERISPGPRLINMKNPAILQTEIRTTMPDGFYTIDLIPGNREWIVVETGFIRTRVCLWNNQVECQHCHFHFPPMLCFLHFRF